MSTGDGCTGARRRRDVGEDGPGCPAGDDPGYLAEESGPCLTEDGVEPPAADDGWPGGDHDVSPAGDGADATPWEAGDPAAWRGGDASAGGGGDASAGGGGDASAGGGGDRAAGDGPDDPAGEAGFREYVIARGPVLMRMALLLTGNRADAEDLLQAALVKTYLGWGRIHERAALDAYVKRAMVNTQISWWRRRRLEEYPTDDVPDRVVADHAVVSDLEDTVRRALDRLPTRMRMAVVLRYYEDMSEPEIADALGVSLGTVKSTVSRAVAKLRIDAELAGGLPGSAPRVPRVPRQADEPRPAGEPR